MSKVLVEQVIKLLQQDVQNLLWQLNTNTLCNKQDVETVLLTKLQLVNELEKYKYTVMSDEEKEELIQSLCNYDNVITAVPNYSKVELADTTITKLYELFRNTDVNLDNTLSNKVEDITITHDEIAQQFNDYTIAIRSMNDAK